MYKNKLQLASIKKLKPKGTQKVAQQIYRLALTSGCDISLSLVSAYSDPNTFKMSKTGISRQSEY